MEDVALNAAFWRDRRVFVTGHTGFKGAWLSLWLSSLGARVRGYSLAPATSPSLFERARVDELLEHQAGDIRDLAELRAALAAAQPEVVFHLAAQSLVRRSYAQPAETHATNVVGTAHVLEAVRGVGAARALIVVTSDKCYAPGSGAHREDARLGGDDPYSASKACAELVTAGFRGLPGGAAIASVRAGNVIGGGDWAEDRLLPDVSRAASASAPVHIRRPAAVRPWQHVLEPLAGYLMLAERLCGEGRRFAQPWNFGPADEDARPVGEVMDRVTALWGEGLRWERDAGAHPAEAEVLRLDSDKARRELGWRPRLRLDEALEWTVRWYKDCLRGSDARELTFRQIERYQALAAV